MKRTILGTLSIVAVVIAATGCQSAPNGPSLDDGLDAVTMLAGAVEAATTALADTSSTAASIAEAAGQVGTAAASASEAATAAGAAAEAIAANDPQAFGAAVAEAIVAGGAAAGGLGVDDAESTASTWAPVAGVISSAVLAILGGVAETKRRSEKKRADAEADKREVFEGVIETTEALGLIAKGSPEADNAKAVARGLLNHRFGDRMAAFDTATRNAPKIAPAA